MTERVVDDFYQKNFSVDEFLNDETEKKHLKDILKQLVELKNENANSMSTVLKEQTESVISIAEKLQSLYKKIDTLHAPVAQLREEVWSLHRQVSTSIASFDEKLSNKSQINKIKWDLTSLAAYHIILKHTRKLIEKYLDGNEKKTEHLERLISKYAFHMHILQILRVTPQFEENDDNIEVPLKSLLKDKLLLAFKSYNVHDLRRIINMYLYLKKKDDLVVIIRDDIVRPLLEPILCEDNLRKHKDDMKILYKESLDILTKDLNIFNTVMISDGIEDFNIIIDCYWVIVDKLLRENLICITAAGHADIFFKHFTDTIQFLEELSVIYGNENLIKENESFVRHLKRFNMLVYYEIRHQEVSSTLESTILKTSEVGSTFYTDSLTRNSPIYLKLQISLSLYLQLKYLFHSSIFIKLLSDQFLKSSFLLMSRYTTWINDFLILNKEHDIEVQKYNLLCILCDLDSLIKEIAFNPEDSSKIEKSIYNILDPIAILQLPDILTVNSINLCKHYNKVKDEFLLMTTSDVMKHLQNVTSIPRLYRRTNKAAPNDHSSYIVDAIRPFISFQRYFDVENPVLINDHRHIMDEMIIICSEEYLTLVKEVLTSVDKTEESLRRLKLRSANPNEDKPESKSDEAKIRLQIKIDVACFVKEISKLVYVEGQTALQELMNESGN